MLTAKRWREKAPENFEFSMKAWQVVTHPATSPSWRRTRLPVSDSEKDNYGFLRLTQENLTAFNETMLICRALRCKICVFQTPPSFGFSEENSYALRQFFGSAKHEVFVAWEPRGTWNEHPDKIQKLCKELDLIHVVDLLRRRPSFVRDKAYIRLHGLNPREYDYKYHYTEKDLSRLLDELRSLESKISEAYILFNNISMFDDARRFLEMTRQSAFDV
jgi:uncharacterized protein YecE (DUF72 family)